MPESTQKTPENDPERNSTSERKSKTTSEGVVEWQCPYCDQTRSEVTQIRDHITQSTEGEHMGINGWSAPDDIVGYTASGDVARVIEGFEPTVSEEDQKERGWKKKQVINAWLARFEKADVDAVTAVTDASRQYVYSLLRDIHNDEFDDQEIVELQDEEFKETLGAELDKFHEQQTQSMSAQPHPEEESEENQISLKRGEGREYLYNTLLLAPEIDHKVPPKVLDLSEEYARGVFKDVREGETSVEEVEEAANEHVQQELQSALETIGALENVDASISDTLDTSIVEEPEAEESEEEEDWPNIEAPSKEIIINSYLLAQEHDVNISPQTVSDAAGCGYEYARRTLKEIREGDVPQYEIRESEAQDMKNTLAASYKKFGYLPDDTEADSTVSAEPDVTEADETEEGEEPELPEVPGSKRDALLNLFTFDVDLTNEEAGNVVGSSAEYARQTFNKIGRGDISEGAIESAQNDEVKGVLRERLGALGYLETEEEPEAESTEEPEAETEPETEVEEPKETVEASVEWSDADEEPAEAATETAAQTTSASAAASEEAPSAESPDWMREEVERVKEHADLLLQQAEYEGDGQAKKAEFIAKKLGDELEEILKKA